MLSGPLHLSLKGHLLFSFCLFSETFYRYVVYCIAVPCVWVFVCVRAWEVWFFSVKCWASVSLHASHSSVVWVRKFWENRFGEQRLLHTVMLWQPNVCMRVKIARLFNVTENNIFLNQWNHNSFLWVQTHCKGIKIHSPHSVQKCITSSAKAKQDNKWNF